MTRSIRISLITTAVAAILLSVVYLTVPKIFYGPLVALNRSMAGLTEHSIEVGRHKIHYLSGGSGEPIILLHGIFAEKDHWVDFARYLTPHFQVIALDLPGFGESSRLPDESYDYPAQVERLSTFMNVLDIPRAHIAGNSMGGAIAILYALQHPDRVLSLAFIGGPHGIRSPESTEIAKRIAAGEVPLIARTPEDFERLLNAVFEKRPFLPRPIYVVARDTAIQNADSNLRLWRDSWRYGYFSPDLLHKIKAPTMAIWGEQDKLFHVSGADVLKAGIRQCSMHIVKGVGHLPMMEEPKESAMLYLSFLKANPIPHEAPVSPPPVSRQ